MTRWRAAAAVAGACCVAPAAAPAQEVTVYSSLPLQGAARPQTTQIVRGIRLALERAGGRAGAATVRYVSLDDSTRQAGTWTPRAVSRNARRAGDDASAVAYIGEFNSGASALSIPILNQAGIMQVSPSNTAIGLTDNGPGADRGEPDKYYPTGRRTYGRIMPNDTVQGRAAGVLLRDLRARRVLVVHDGEVYGRGLARLAARAARAKGLRVVATRRLGRRGRNAATLSRLARRLRANAVFYGGITANGAVRLRRSLHARARRVEFVGGDGVAESGFTEQIGSGAARRTRVLVTTLDAGSYPESGQEVLRTLATRESYALYGFEAMSLVLDAIAHGGPTRQGAVGALFDTRDRDSVLGRYSIDANGDTTLSAYGVYRVSRGELVFERGIDASS